MFSKYSHIGAGTVLDINDQFQQLNDMAYGPIAPLPPRLLQLLPTGAKVAVWVCTRSKTATWHGAQYYNVIGFHTIVVVLLFLSRFIGIGSHL